MEREREGGKERKRKRQEEMKINEVKNDVRFFYYYECLYAAATVNHISILYMYTVHAHTYTYINILHMLTVMMHSVLLRSRAFKCIHAWLKRT